MSTLRKVALVVIAGGSLVVGVWAQGFPRSFYDDFPGMGRVWVAVDGPYNEHLVRDVGGLNLALAFVAVMALVTGSTLLAPRRPAAPRCSTACPTSLYHATHLDPYDTGDAVAHARLPRHRRPRRRPRRHPGAARAPRARRDRPPPDSPGVRRAAGRGLCTRSQG